MSYILSHLSDLAYRAYCGTSFSPEKRRDHFIKDYSEQLDADLAGMPEEHRAEYQAGYVRRIRAWLSAKSNCISSMIAGPSNFPVRRAEKANRAEEARYKEFNEWREKALKRIAKACQPDVDPLEEARRKLAARKEAHELMKRANAVIRKKGGVEGLIAAGIKPALAEELLKPGRFGGDGFAAFELSNNLAEIKRLEGRVAELEAKAQQAEAVGTKELTFAGGRLIINYTIDRVQVAHDTKPERAVIEQLKRSGFRWAPSEGAWQRQLTINGLVSAADVTGIDRAEVIKLARN